MGLAFSGFLAFLYLGNLDLGALKKGKIERTNNKWCRRALSGCAVVAVTPDPTLSPWEPPVLLVCIWLPYTMFPGFLLKLSWMGSARKILVLKKGPEQAKPWESCGRCVCVCVKCFGLAAGVRVFEPDLELELPCVRR